MTETSPTVFIVDDDNAVRKGLVRLLSSAGYRAEGYPSADAFLAHWESSPAPGCLLLDVQMPGLDGISLQQRLQASPPAIPIIFITGHGDIPMSVTAMKAGAVDFFAKPFKDEDLLAAVREAIALDARERSARDKREAAAEGFRSLTKREREVMALVVRGMPNKQIAFALGASEKTIKIHRSRVMQKMKASSLAALVRAADKLGILPEASPLALERP